MGTRHTIEVIYQGETRIKQYGQWDGYLEGQGAGIANFLVNADLDKFKENLLKCSWLTKEEAKLISDIPNWPERYPHLSRDAGHKILEMIPCKLWKSPEEDKKWTEFDYVINMDNNTVKWKDGPEVSIETFAETCGVEVKPKLNVEALIKEADAMRDAFQYLIEHTDPDGEIATHGEWIESYNKARDSQATISEWYSLGGIDIYITNTKVIAYSVDENGLIDSYNPLKEFNRSGGQLNA